MTISEIIFLLDATPLSQTVQTDHKIETVCGLCARQTTAGGNVEKSG